MANKLQYLLFYFCSLIKSLTLRLLDWLFCYRAALIEQLPSNSLLGYLGNFARN